MSKHTKGPWTITKRNTDRQPDAMGKSISIDTEDGITIAELGAGINNARLISAAPELLDIAKQMLDRLLMEKIAAVWETPQDHQLEIEIYRSIIAKAEGSTDPNRSSNEGGAE